MAAAVITFINAERIIWKGLDARGGGLTCLPGAHTSSALADLAAALQKSNFFA
jgi:hypothetical protein